MNIFSWNVNGVRAIHKKGGWDEIMKRSPDIILLQETKSEADQLPDEVKAPPGYQSAFWSSRERRGYAGTAIYVKNSALESLGVVLLDGADDVTDDDDPTTFATKTLAPYITFGFAQGITPEDRHGRLLTLDAPKVAILVGYLPNGKSKTAPLDFKLEFYEAVHQHISALTKQDKPVILLGDFNVAHHPIDLARPEENKNTSGFLPIERAWIDRLLADGWHDAWRKLNPDVIEYTWWDMKSAARDRNIGWRIDYALANDLAMHNITAVQQLQTVMHSDHCPVEVGLTL